MKPVLRAALHRALQSDDVRLAVCFNVGIVIGLALLLALLFALRLFA